MKAKSLMILGTSLMGLAACTSGDINLSPSTNISNSNNTTNNGGGTSANAACASYQNTGGQTIQGKFNSTTNNCEYSSAFADNVNPIKTDLFIPALENDGAHVFAGSLFIGEAHDSDADLTAAGIAEGGDGPTLTIEAGATLAFTNSSKFMIINRGAQIVAVGTPDAPITLTSTSDIDGSVGPEDVQQWGGVVINGFGVTNKCAYTGNIDPNADGNTDDSTLVLDSECHVAAEGAAGNDASFYGGNNNADSSGRLEYVIVKHTGAQVANGDELNGISFGGVGKNTVVSNLQVYSTFDDGIEMFGGEFDIENLVAIYVRDDSIDVDEGWRGTINNALVIQAESDGQHCIESDGIGSYSGLTPAARAEVIAEGINSRITVNNLTCIVSANDSATGTHGDGAGWRFREGIFFNVTNSQIITSFSANDQTAADDNYCLRVDNDETEAGWTGGDSSLSNVIFACQETFKDGAAGFEGTNFAALASESAAATIADGTAKNPTAAADADLVLLEGTQPVFSVDYSNALVDGAAAPGTPDNGKAFIGAVQQAADFTSPWAYGIDPANRGQALWFE